MIDYVVTRRLMIWRWEVFTDPPRQGLALSFARAKAEAKAVALEAVRTQAAGTSAGGAAQAKASGMKRLLTLVGLLSLAFWAAVIYTVGRMAGVFD